MMGGTIAVSPVFATYARKKDIKHFSVASKMTGEQGGHPQGTTQRAPRKQDEDAEVEEEEEATEDADNEPPFAEQRTPDVNRVSRREFNPYIKKEENG